MSELNEIYQSDKLELHRNQFWQAVWIWNQRPHIVNRRLFGIKTFWCFTTEELVNFKEIITKLKCTSYDDLKSTTSEKEFTTLMLPIRLKKSSEEEMLKISTHSYFAIRKLLNKSRNYDEAFEVGIFNYQSDEALYYQIVDGKLHKAVNPSASFVLSYINNYITIEVLENQEVTCSHDWLKFLLLPKLTKWMIQASTSDYFDDCGKTSLCCIDSNRYNELYMQLKDKYGKEIVEKWPENTDPSKFVFEDIAIATYLCLLWNDEKVTFVDLGCGNGLLVHILNSEGHRGFGIDIRSRKIWSLYSPTPDLKVGIITPTENSYFPDVDWIIGNHSDELTPWIPFFALRNSYKCKFFLLPCCAYEFSGQKYQRQNSSVSVYNDYINYIKTICSDFKFEIKSDKLRIPSTKRICIVGYSRNYDISTYNSLRNEKIDAFLQLYDKCGENQFKPRESIERARNCTQIDRKVSSRIVEIISKSLITNQLKIVAKTSASDVWSIEYSISFPDAISLLNTEDLKKLKCECGGLQTLLRNHHFIFLIRRGRIQFRKPIETEKDSNKWKIRSCWFFKNHPFGCPLEENKCSFIH